MTDIRLVDVTMRDGNQSLWGATGLNTAHMLQAAALTEACGFRAIDFTSSSHMAVAVRYFRNNPWERLRRMASAIRAVPSGEIFWLASAALFVGVAFFRRHSLRDLGAPAIPQSKETNHG